MRRRTRKIKPLIALTAVMGLLLAACGDGDDQPAAEAPASDTPEETDTPDSPEEPTDDPTGGYEDGDVISIVFGANPGGGYDVQSAVFVDYLQPVLRELTGADVTVVNEAQPGGGGAVSIEHVAAADPDGLTLLYIIAANPVQHALIDGSSIDFREWEHLAHITVTPRGFVAPAALEDELESWDFQGLQALSEERSILIGVTSGAEEIHAIFGGILPDAGMDIDYDVVIYDGGSDLATAVLRGEIDLVMSNVAGYIPIAEDNPDDVKFFATGACERQDVIPDVPTLAEMGMPEADLICANMMETRRVVSGPPGMDAATVSVLREAFEIVLTDPAYIEEFEATADLDAEFWPGTDIPSYIDGLFDLWADYADLVP